MPSRLDNLVSIGQLKPEPPAQAELDGLLGSGAARIKDAENESLSVESRFDLAYNAAHAFQTLTDSIGLSPAEWRVLDEAHKKRNLIEYEGSADLDLSLIAAMIRVAREVEKRVRALGPIS